MILEAPARAITIRNAKATKRELTPEQKAEIANRLKQSRNSID